MTSPGSLASEPETSRTDALADAAGPARLDSARLALLAFALLVPVALVLYLVGSRHQWFALDEWQFLAGRSASSMRDLFEPHNEHWMTFPILTYRALWQLFGLRTYVPYQLTTILLHLVAAALLRVVMRRAGVRPWFATTGAALFLLFGAGSEDITWGANVGWAGAVVLGLVHLLLADHDDPVDWRDGLGVVAGIAALMCSGVGVTMVLVVGLAALLRRGWRAAAVHTVPLVAIFGLWWSFLGPNHLSTDPTLRQVVDFVATGVGATFGGLGQVPGIGIALGVMLVAGLIVAWRHPNRRDVRRVASMPAALLVGGFVAFVISAQGRAVYGADFVRQGRYLYIAAAMSVPALTVAADALARRWRILTSVTLALLLIGVPGNIGAIDERNPFQLGEGTRELVLALPRLDLARRVPRALRPSPVPLPDVTIGWLLDGVRSGRIPRPSAPPSHALRRRMELMLSLMQTSAWAPSTGCERLDRARHRHLRRGDVLDLDDAQVRVAQPGGAQNTYQTVDGRTVRVIRDIDVSVIPVYGAVSVC